jgi:gliding motility-associated-like protein
MEVFYQKIKDLLSDYEESYDESQWIKLQKTLKINRIKKLLFTSSIIIIPVLLSILLYNTTNRNKTATNLSTSKINIVNPIDPYSSLIVNHIVNKPISKKEQSTQDQNISYYLTDADIDSLIPIPYFIDEISVIESIIETTKSEIETHQTSIQLTKTDTLVGIDTTKIPKPTYYFPTAFSPNGDGTNDEFFPIGIDLINLEFQLLVYDRWGNQVFESMNVEWKWNGDNCKSGIYIWIFKYQDNDGKIHLDKGQITLIK